MRLWCIAFVHLILPAHNAEIVKFYGESFTFSFSVEGNAFGGKFSIYAHSFWSMCDLIRIYIGNFCFFNFLKEEWECM